jgi:hypothetical protein
LSDKLNNSNGVSVEKLLSQKNDAENKFMKARELMNKAHEKLTNIQNSIQELKLRAVNLEESSHISADLQAALDALDRRQLSEIAKLGQPPPIVQQALEIVWIFIDMFEQNVFDFNRDDNNDEDSSTSNNNDDNTNTNTVYSGKAAAGAASPSTNVRPTSSGYGRATAPKSPPRGSNVISPLKKKNSTPSKKLDPTSPATPSSSSSSYVTPNNSNSAKESELSHVAKLAQVRTWAEIRKQMAIDLHPHIAVRIRHIYMDGWLCDTCILYFVSYKCKTACAYIYVVPYSLSMHTTSQKIAIKKQ